MKKKFFLIFANMIMFVLATLCSGGGIAMAMAVGTIGSDTDPNKTVGTDSDGNPTYEGGNALADATKDSLGMGIDQQGHGSTGSAVDEADLDDDQINDYVMRYNAWKYPLHTDILNIAKKRMVKTKHPKHPVVGEAILECFTNGAITNNTDKAETVTLPLHNNDKKIFQTRSTIRVFGYTGYDEAGTANGSVLMLYVVDNHKNTTVTVRAVNGPINSDTGLTYVPNIASGTKLRCMASACEEDVYDVAPDNFLPGWRQAYLQRKVCNITKTEFYEKMKKKVQGIGQLSKDIALDTFRRKCTSTALIGAPGKIRVYNETLKTELDCFFQEGVVSQIPASYQLNGIPTVEDLIAITRLSFTKHAKSNRAQGYCDPLFMEWLSNMDFSKHPEIQFSSQRDKLGVKVGTFETNFGTIEWKLDYSLEENDLRGVALIIPMEKAIRYVYEETVEKDDNSDKKINANSQYHVIEDCVMLTGLTSLYVGQDITASGNRSEVYNTSFVSVTSLTGVSSPSTNKVYYLTKNEGSNLIGAYVYKNSAWVKYAGTASA